MLQASGQETRANGVIWITGYSAAGKTTVGRKVETELRSRGLSTVFLDGDDLRSILAARWGYERDDRVELARVYFRLCSHLAAQGHTVVIAAVAMYSEVREWLRENVPGAMEFYLDVPEEERRRRDDETKKVYQKIGDLAKMYDQPDDRTIKVSNVGDRSPERAALFIVEEYLAQKSEGVDFGRQHHWAEYYSRHEAPVQPSPFAKTVALVMQPNVRILEIGCGNGRDAVFFDHCGHSVTAIDVSSEAIQRCKETHEGTGITFLAGALQDVAPTLGHSFDVLYSRFVLHAMPLREEEKLLRAAANVLRHKGSFFIECRSINDPMAREGEVISPTERILGHYRRFIVREELEERLRSCGFEVRSATEARGLAVHGDEDPVVIRIEAMREK